MNSSLPEARHHRQRIREAFNRAAGTYDEAAQVQREICRALLDLSVRTCPDSPLSALLDAGCGTGYALPELARCHAPARLIALDFAPGMLQRIAPGVERICADLESMPLPSACIPAIFSSLALQWCTPESALREFTRVLAPGGNVWLATLGPQSLHELREAFTAVDAERHVMHFHSSQHWRTAAEAAGLEVLSLHTAPHFVHASSLRGIIGHIKAIGAHRPAATPRTPLTRAQWRRLETAYEQFREAGRLRATYDVIYLAARKPDGRV